MAALAARQSPGGAAAAAIRPLPLPSGTRLCPPRGGPGMAVRKRTVRWRRSQPRMQSTRRPLPSALPVAKVKGSGSSRRLRPLRLHLLSLCVSRACHRRDHRSPYTPWPADFAHRDRTSSDLSRPSLQPAAPARDCPAERPSTPQWSFPLSAGAVGQARARPVLAYQPNPGAVQSPSPQATHPSPRGGVQSETRCRLPAPPPPSWPPRNKPTGPLQF